MSEMTKSDKIHHLYEFEIKEILSFKPHFEINVHLWFERKDKMELFSSISTILSYHASYTEKRE